MFGRTKTTVTRIELTDESKQALTALDNDIQALQSLMSDLVANSTKILHALSREVIAQVPSDEGGATYDVLADSVGVRAFDGDEDLAPYPKVAITPRVPDADRVRNSPFSRTPRSVQVAWLQRVMGDGGWFAPATIARAAADNEREYRALRSAVGSRLREMTQDGQAERRDSHTRGSMFEYRLLLGKRS